MVNLSSQPLITVITPTFNRRRFIGEAIESVINQTYGNLEHLIIDDGSEDNTGELVESYQKKDGRIHYFYQANQGQSVARNLGLKHARGDYICFLDSDNYWFLDKLEKSLAAFQKYPETDILYGDCVIINEAGDEISRKTIKRHSGYIAPLLLRDNFVSINTSMTKRHCFEEMGGMSNKVKVADDYELWLRFSSKYLFYYLPEFLACYRVMENQISSDKRRRFEANEAIIVDFLKKFPEAVTPKEAKEGLSHFYSRKARYYASIGDKRVAWKAILFVFRYSPFSGKPWRSIYRVLFPVA